MPIQRYMLYFSVSVSVPLKLLYCCHQGNVDIFEVERQIKEFYKAEADGRVAEFTVRVDCHYLSGMSSEQYHMLSY